MSGSRVHLLKCWPEPFAAVLSGAKRHEIRKDDRGFEVGDLLHLAEWAPQFAEEAKAIGGYWTKPLIGGDYTGASAHFRVTYKTPGGAWGLPADLCVLSIERVDGAP